MLQSQVNRKQTAQIVSLPAPVGGLNARDSYAAMPPTDAVVLSNFFPTPSYLAVRNGFANWVTSIPSAVHTLACYSQAGGTRKLFAVAGSNLYDVTTQGALGSAVVSSLSLDWWQFVNFGAGGNQYLVMVDGADPMLLYNGRGWESCGDGTGATITSGTASGTTCTITTATAHMLATGTTITVTGATPSAYNVTNASITVTGANTFTYTAGTAPGGSMSVIGIYTYAPSITGVLTSSFVNVNVFQGRLFFIAKNSMQVWFLPLLSVGGAATLLDLSTQTRLGGYLVAMATWTVETTAGMTQMACFITSEGEVLVYQGNDPTYASSWYQVGTFRVGRPVGYRCTVKIGSDVGILTVDGLVPLSKAMLTDRTQREIALTDKIQNLINADVQSYSAYLGWQPILSPIGNKLLLNVPAPQGAYQYVMNTITGAWTVFSGWAANCFELVGDSLYFGGASGVYQCDTGNSDGGGAIACEAIQAASYFGSHTQKQFTMSRPILVANAAINPAFQINVDYNFSAPTNYTSFATARETPWNSAWGSPWSAVSTTYKNWISTGALGYAGSPAIAFSVNGVSAQWQATDVAFNVGGPL